MKGKIKSDAVGISLIKVNFLDLLHLYRFVFSKKPKDRTTICNTVCASLQGVEQSADGLKLISDVIVDKLGITMSVLMGANIANEVAEKKFCETTIGSSHCDVACTFFFFCAQPSGFGCSRFNWRLTLLS